MSEERRPEKVDRLKRLKGVTFRLERYEQYSDNWDHDHCEVCWEKLAVTGEPDTISQGYATLDRLHWVCEPCFNELKDNMGW